MSQNMTALISLDTNRSFQFCFQRVSKVFIKSSDVVTNVVAVRPSGGTPSRHGEKMQSHDSSSGTKTNHISYE